MILINIPNNAHSCCAALRCAVLLPPSQVLRRPSTAYTPQRSPAWTDRVLYRSNLPLKQVSLCCVV